MKHATDITAFINSLRSVSGVGICYYDLKDFFNYFRTGVRNNCGHYCDFCRAVRELPGGKHACEKSDKIEAVSLAAQYRQPFFFACVSKFRFIEQKHRIWLGSPAGGAVPA